MNLENSLLLVQNLNRKSLFAELHSDIDSLKSGLFHLTGQLYCKNGRLAKVKDGIRNYSLRNYLILRYKLSYTQQGDEEKCLMTLKSE
jgi:hypothetical protein